MLWQWQRRGCLHSLHRVGYNQEQTRSEAAFPVAAVLKALHSHSVWCGMQNTSKWALRPQLCLPRLFLARPPIERNLPWTQPHSLFTILHVRTNGKRVLCGYCNLIIAYFRQAGSRPGAGAPGAEAPEVD